MFWQLDEPQVAASSVAPLGGTCRLGGRVSLYRLHTASPCKCGNPYHAAQKSRKCDVLLHVTLTSIYSATDGQARKAAVQSSPIGIQLTCTCETETFAGSDEL